MAHGAGLKTDASSSFIIAGGNLVLKDAVVKGAVAVEDGRIAAVLEREDEAARWREMRPEAAVVDARGKYVLPGLIDIHCDAIEKEVQPRPGTLFPLELALLEFERKLPLHGITTMYHSLSLGVGLSLRGDHLLTGMVDCIHRFAKARSMVRNRIHLRFEVSHHPGLPIVERYLEEGRIHYLSFMDHSPGQGQYRAPGSFERYVMKNQGVTAAEVQEIVDDLMKRRQQVDGDRLKRLGRLAAAKGIAVASHDDDSPEKVEESRSCGATVSEFPINLATARHAAGLGMRVCVGAPNVVRGGSHDHNLRAIDAIEEGSAHILCSDYHPSSLLAAVFKLAESGAAGLPEAVGMASLRPAEAMGTAGELGSIEPGKAADLILVDRYEGMPWVTDAFVGGSHVFSAAARSGII
jgi:Metal-dependent hydrolase involved in phosphonate metabolism